MKLRAMARGALGLVVTVSGCDSSGTIVPLGGESDHSASIAVSVDGSTVYVVNADSDSVSFVDTASRRLVREVLLAAAAPALDASGRYEPSVEPRALALGPGESTLYVTGRRSGHVYAIDTASGAVVADADVCSEPVGVVASADGTSVYVACSEDDAIAELDASSLAVTAQVACSRRPWSLGWSADRSSLYATHLLGPGVSVLRTSPLVVAGAWSLADGVAATASPTTPHGQVRGIYDVLQRPGSDERWVAEMMLGTDTPQPTLQFDSTAFAALSLLDGQGKELARLTVSTQPGDGGAFGDVVSGPRALAFTPDGRFAMLADTGSEDVLVVDAVNRVEAALVRPLPGHQPEGIAVSGDGHAYVDERNTSDVAVLDIAVQGRAVTVTVDGVILRTGADPMPGDLRLGQHLFYSANSDELPLTTDHWVSCATCHLEGRTDAVTWRFTQGPRDTPSNAGGVLQTGFLFRTATRTRVQDYWRTIDEEQGGHFSTSVPALAADLDALEHYVDRAIPYPSPPRGLDPAAVAQGAALFASLGCPTCHSGPAFTDSGSGNPALDLGGTVVLHDVGTCVTEGPYDDNAVPDIDGNPRGACAFDTPTLRGVADSAPYLHDGRAQTLDDVFQLAPGMAGDAVTKLGAADHAALIAYLESL